MAAAFFNAHEGVALFLRQFAEDFFLNRLSHAEDRMQRRAEFVAHHGEKFIFHPRGAGKFGVRALEFRRALFDAPG